VNNFFRDCGKKRPGGRDDQEPPLMTSPARTAARLRAVVIDDHAAIAEMTARFLEAAGLCEVIGSSRDAAAAMELCRLLQPDLIVLDLRLGPSAAGRRSGLSLLPELRAACPGGRVLVFSGHLQPGTIRRLLALGVNGLVEKSAAGEELRAALSALAAGQIYYSRHVSDQIRRMIQSKGAERSALIPLSEREESILEALAEGLSSKEIAARLGISVHTVVNHRVRLAKKTGLRGTACLARYAAELGLVGDLSGVA
jgi:DNA-binding NarL/FixJ family response regulator